jgi:hypothetical protein
MRGIQTARSTATQVARITATQVARITVIVSVVAGLGAASAGCGAAPGSEPTTPTAAADLRPLEVSRPEATLAGMDGTHATVNIRVIVANPNQAAVTMRRVDGQLLLDGQQAANIEVEGDELLDADSERAFVFDVRVPLALLASVQAREYVARGTLYADGGSGDAALQSPFELSGPVPAQ